MADYSRILVISDTQAPFHHPDALPFLSEVKKQFKPTFIIHIGDLADFHSLNFHGVNPSLPSAHDELILLRAFVKNLAKLFPSMTIVDSNHDALPKRKARSVGIPDEMLKDERSIMQAPSTWKYVTELVFKLPNGLWCKAKHNFGSNLLMDSIKQGMSVICGHLHSKSFIHWWQNDHGMNFAVQTGCLINDRHAAFEYNKGQSTRPVLTLTVILGGIPMNIPMYVNKKNEWLGYI
jgi:predicted phosphodiesterase